LERNINELETTQFDLVVVGGGIFGACAVWEAALRGLRVALIEKNDFSHATSANHFKMAHCGIRYLQHGDILRMRESCKERSILLRIAPHLVYTVPMVIPTYGYGNKGKFFLGTGMTLYDLLTADRNKGLNQDKKIKLTKFINKKELLSLFPHLPAKGLTGAAVYEEGQMYNPPRLALSFIKSAQKKGAVIANYTEAIDFEKSADRITGVVIKDHAENRQFSIKSKIVLNTAGPWAYRLLKNSAGISLKEKPTFSRDLAFVIPKFFQNNLGLALATQTKDADSLLDRGGRHLFAFPWRDYTLIGVWHKVFKDSSEKLFVTPEELEAYRSEVAGAYPGLCQSYDDIKVVNMGLTLFGDEDKQIGQNISFGKRSQIIDHKNENKIDGLVTLIGVRATMARGMAAKALDVCLKKLNHKTESGASEQHPIWGGDFKNSNMVIKNIKRDCRSGISDATASTLFQNYGSGYKEVLKYAEEEPELYENVPGTTTMKAEIVHAVREEMALNLKDIIFRRTDLGTGCPPDDAAMKTCAEIAARELKWSEAAMTEEISQVYATYPRLG
jgi:glycerol-3-phosphate dehydrogenase